MRSYKELFVNPSDNGKKWDENFIKLLKDKNKDKWKEFLIQTDAKQLFMEETRISYCINEFTISDNSDEYKKKLIDSLKNLKDFVQNAYVQKNEKFKSNEIIVETKNGIIRAMPLSECIPDLISLYPDIESNDRKGKCFERSYELSRILDMQNNLVTGYIYGNSDKAQYLHSWLETKNNFVIDYTRNAIINKDGYYLMLHAEPLSKISAEDIENDIQQYMSKCNRLGISLEQYLIFRDEIIKDFQKNDNLFQEER